MPALLELAPARFELSVPCERVGYLLSSYVEVWGPSGRELRPLDSERLTVGTLESNDVVVDADVRRRLERHRFIGIAGVVRRA